MSESSGNIITAFHGIFEQKYKNIVKQIKNLRKTKNNPEAKENLKRLISEAKGLQKILKKERKQLKSESAVETIYRLMIENSLQIKDILKHINKVKNNENNK